MAQATCEAPSESYQHKKFVHFAGVIDALNQQMRIYINGEKVAQCPYPGSQIRDGLKPIRIGGYYRTVAEESGLTGVLDEVRVYNRALSDADIQELFLFVP